MLNILKYFTQFRNIRRQIYCVSSIQLMNGEVKKIIMSENSAHFIKIISNFEELIILKLQRIRCNLDYIILNPVEYDTNLKKFVT
jgi:hypothetical protein